MKRRKTEHYYEVRRRLDGKPVAVAQETGRENAETVAEDFFRHATEPKPWVEIVSVTRVTTTEVVKVLTPETFEKRKNPHTPDRFIEPKRRWA